MPSHDPDGTPQPTHAAAVPPPAPTGPPPAPPATASPSASARPAAPSATPSLATQLSALPAAVAGYAEDASGHLSPYVVGADALAGLAASSSLALAVLRRRGLI
ncbi:MAG TPA: hypothetical protein VFC09_03190 [Candidatus Dormibacteraeota bacterium]|nr:hypothetical protein [Candidatus Dormibacteraeota bacterium]